MLRALLSILALFALPLQGMAVPHSHPGQAVPVDHESTPHVHLHGHSHGHSHHTHGPRDNTRNERPAKRGEDGSLDVDSTDCDCLLAGAAADAGGLCVNVCQQSGLANQQPVRVAVKLVLRLATLESTEILRAHTTTNCAEPSHYLGRGTLPLYMATLSLRL